MNESRFALYYRAVGTGLLATLALAACSQSDSEPYFAPPNPADLPLLGDGPNIGIVYSEAAPAAKPALDMAFGEAIVAGANTYELVLSWAVLETAPGVIDTAYLDSLFTQFMAAGLAPYLNITTIDTVQLNLPAEFIDPLDSTSLAAGVSFADAALITRFEALLDALVPRLVAAGGFFLGVGNEVDVWLASHPGDGDDYLTFLEAARAHTRTLDARLAVGVAVTSSVLQAAPTTFDALRQATDAVAFTYYGIGANFAVVDPSVVAVDIATMAAAVAPDPLLLQEVGYPAGYAMNGQLGSSEAMQAAFITNVFNEIAATPRLRFASFLHLADWSPSDLDTFTAYYGSADPEFREFLGTLGLREYADGAPKAGWTAFLDGLLGL